MKQIKVYITAEQWAEKRLQLMIHAKSPTMIEIIDHEIRSCGFELIEPETKPEQLQTKD